MYLIRSLGEPRAIYLECSGEVTSAEAMRAISQVASLADVDHPGVVVCDLRAVEQGPADTLAIVATLRAAASPAYRITLIAAPWQHRFVERLMRLARLPQTPAIFPTPADAGEWLATVDRGAAASSTARRHARDAAHPPSSNGSPARRTSAA